MNLLILLKKKYIGNKAVRGFYILPKSLINKIPTLKKSKRGEFEIVDLLNKIKFSYQKISKSFDLGSVQGIQSFIKAESEAYTELDC